MNFVAKFYEICYTKRRNKFWKNKVKKLSKAKRAIDKKSKGKKKRGVGKRVFLFILLILLVAGGFVGYKVHKNGGGLKGLLATAVGHDENTLKNLPKIYCV